MSVQLERCSPEAAGIPSKAIANCLDLFARRGIEMHSVMVLRHGKVCAEGWWKPYSPAIPHPVFSFGKSITSTAIGFAEQEGILSVEEKLVDLFADKLPENPSENLKKATLHHLLSMSCGHEQEPRTMEEDWIRAFLAHEFKYEPGTMFQYNNAGTNMLVAALQRKTGMKLTEFLKPRLFDPLGITDVTCAIRGGYELGAFGFKLTTDGMARFAQFVLQRGMWNGQRLLGEQWFDKATAKQIGTLGGVYDGKKDWAAGYCYQYWRMEKDDTAFRADGACGQFAFFIPRHDAIVITTAGTGLTQGMVDTIWETIVPAMSETTLPQNPADERALTQKLQSLQIMTFFPGRSDENDKRFHGRTYTAEQEIPGIAGLFGGFGLRMGVQEKLSAMTFAFDGDVCTLHCLESGAEKAVRIGLAGDFITESTDGSLYAGVGRWRAPNAFEAEIRSMDSVNGNRLIFRFADDGMTLTVDPTMFMAGAPSGTAPSPVYRFR